MDFKTSLDRYLTREPDEYPCEICGNHVDDCVCPECPVCEIYGDPDCYKNHGLTLTKEQIETKAKNDEERRLSDEAEAKYWAEAEAEAMEIEEAEANERLGCRTEQDEKFWGTVLEVFKAKGKI